MPDDKLDKMDEKARKKEEKRRKKMEKKGAAATTEVEAEEEDDDTSFGGKIAVFLATIVISTLWIAILILMVKWDVGGFGSTVMYPVFKDVPYINKILPEVELSIEEQEYPYVTVSDATDRVKELELELDGAEETIKNQEDKISELEAMVERLQVYQQREAEFEEIRQKFDEEVVFSDVAPDISNYQEYYESISPENAEIIYRQVLEQQQYSKEVQDYSATYASMKPKEAAEIFDTMTEQLNLVADILLNMDTQSRADILGNMDPEIAARITAIMEP